MSHTLIVLVKAVKYWWCFHISNFSCFWSSNTPSTSRITYRPQIHPVQVESLIDLKYTQYK